MERHEHPQTIAEALAKATATNPEILTDALYALETHAGNDHNPPMWKELYKALSVLTEKLEAAESYTTHYTRAFERQPDAAGSEYIEGMRDAYKRIITAE